MPDDFVDLIKSTGYTRVVIRPTDKPEELTVSAARDLVQKSSVSLRGWDYPHISHRNDANGGSETFSTFAQDWCNWQHHREFWRMYKSGQFLHYKALREDLQDDDRKPTGLVFAISSFSYTATEVMEFAYRLFRHGLYQHGADVQLTIGRSRGRQLWVDDPMRMGFSTPRVTSSETIEVARTLTRSDFETTTPSAPALSMILEVFEAFGWQASPEQISRTQKELYGFGYGRDR